MTMNRKGIEKAVAEYAARANPSFTNGDFDRNAVAQAFEDGAEWRINSVWHNCSKELPTIEGKWILLEVLHNGNLLCVPVKWINDELGAMPHMIRWAYLDELMPERKEETK